MLDIETITGVAGNVEAEFWGFKGNSPDNPNNEPFMKWLMLMSNTSDADVPKAYDTSTSWTCTRTCTHEDAHTHARAHT